MLNITNMQEDLYYTIDDVAKMLKVVYLTVYRWIQTDKLTAIKAGKQYRIAKKDLDTFIQLNKKS